MLAYSQLLVLAAAPAAALLIRQYHRQSYCPRLHELACTRSWHRAMAAGEGAEHEQHVHDEEVCHDAQPA